MKIILIALILVSSMTVMGQDTANETAKPRIQKGFGVTVAQVQPQFPGGEDSLKNFLKSNLVYPENAKQNHIQGRVYVGFMVDRTGKIVKPRILSSASADLDAEALRVVGMMPLWTPGSAGGTPIDIQYILPIDFISPPMAPAKNE